MRKEFVNWLLEKMSVDEDVILLTADLGYGLLDPVREKFPDRFWNVGASEQLLLGCGVGASLEGKKPFLYSITPFLLYRPAEWIRNYLVNEGIKCILVGSGLYEDYSHDGFSHHSFDHYEFCEALDLNFYEPSNVKDLGMILDKALKGKYSSFVGLRR